MHEIQITNTQRYINYQRAHTYYLFHSSINDEGRPIEQFHSFEVPHSAKNEEDTQDTATTTSHEQERDDDLIRLYYIVNHSSE